MGNAMMGNAIGESDSDSYYSSTDDEMEQRTTRYKNKEYFESVVPMYSEAVFVEHFRVRRHVAENLAEQFGRSSFYDYRNGGYTKLIPLKQILIFLWFAGHQTASFRDVGDRFGIAISTLGKLIHRVTRFISSLAVDVIKWPSAEERVIIEGHFRRNGFPGVVGAIDGTHIRIDRPENDPDSYINRKGFFAIQLQVVADHKRRIRDIFVGHTGSVHDARVFRTSPLFATLEEKCGEMHILGDSAYPCLTNLLTPFRNTGNLSRRQNKFNKVLSKNRCVVKHCYGLLKQRFRRLYHIKLRAIEDIVHFIQACCVLHNLAVEDNLEFEEAEGEDDDLLPNAAAGDEALQLEIRDERGGVNKRNMIADLISRV